jgi:hypothetical protein
MRTLALEKSQFLRETAAVAGILGKVREGRQVGAMWCFGAKKAADAVAARDGYLR